MQQIDNRFTQWLSNRADANAREMIEELTIALQTGTIPIIGTSPATTPQNFAGGVNYCPNSDLRFSKRAATVPGALPSDAGDENYEAFRFYRQLKTDNITADSAHALKSSAHSLYAANEGANAHLPVWNRVFGHIEMGTANIVNLADVAVQLYQNPIRAGMRIYARVEASVTAPGTIVPEDLEMYCGIWHKKSASEGYISGSPFVLGYQKFYTPGLNVVSYKVIAENDAGQTIESQILNITDAPAAFTPAEFIRITYNGLQGYTKFKIYREQGGVFYSLGEAVNTNNLSFDDTGAYRGIIPAFPSVPQSVRMATAQSFNFRVGANGIRIVNDFTIDVPGSYNETETLPDSQFLRFGLTKEVAANRDILIDRIYLGKTFNDWSDSPFDTFLTTATASTSATSGGTTIGGGGTPPGPGTGGCIVVNTPVLRFNFDKNPEWLPLEQIPHGDLLESGDLDLNVVQNVLFSEVKEYWYVETQCGVRKESSLKHRYVLPDKNKTPVTAETLKSGDYLRGMRGGRVMAMELKISEKRIGKRRVGIPVLGGNHLLVSGFSDDGESGLFDHNQKDRIDIYPEIIL